jgi:phage terminase large subunit
MVDNLIFKDCQATRKIFSLTKRIRAVAGGTSASKTISIIIWLIDYAQSVNNEIITVVAESVPHLKLGAIRDFQNIMKSNSYWSDSYWNATDFKYNFSTGSIIEFVSFDKFGKAHGPRRDILFVNEANNLPYNIVDQLITRTRKIIWLDWNPTSEFWYYTEMEGKRDDIDFITLTYKDCLNVLDQTIIDEIESHKNNKSWWQVYGLGQLGEIEGLIYKHWRVIDEIPYEARLERRWLDFGYTNDPSAIGDIYYYNGGWILDEQLYKKGMSNKQLADFLNSLEKPQTLIVADSAEPKSIDEIRSYGLNIIPSQKGKDSVVAGIQLVQDQPISVTRRSYNILNEQRNYMWLVDKNGKILNEEDPSCANHHMSGIRYALSTLGRLKQEESYWDRIFNDELDNKTIILNKGI